MDLTTGQDTQQLINSAQSNVRYNNQWSADQAQKQMDFQSSSNAKAMQFNAEQSQLNRDFQERMSNTAHQREVSDLIKAGLNPVLSAKLGGSSTPTGSSASGVASQGSKGDTDSSMTNMFSGMLNALISQATALSTTAMNNSTALQSTQMNNLTNLQATKMMNDTAVRTGQIGANAMLGTANINSMTQYGVQQKQQAFEQFMKQNYPQNLVGGASSMANGLMSLFKGDYDAKSAATKKQVIHNIATGFGLFD